MNSDFLLNVFIFLAASCLVVPLAGRLKLGSVLGYLLAGVLLGPYGAGFIHDPERIMHFAEFGVVMMLFLIGLDLEPESLWRLRGRIVGLGGLQVVLTSLACMAAGQAMGYSWQVSLGCGMALALSSTALVLSMLQERGLMLTAPGESAFAVLLLQDIAVIPILIILPLLKGSGSDVDEATSLGIPAWAHALLVVGVIAAIIFVGRYLSRYLFNYVAKTNLREIFTAISLALVVGIALLMQMIGVSAALGAFVAGVVLASSEYRRTLQTDIEPFKGLLLGLFFISVGMGMEFSLFEKELGTILGLVAGLVAMKAVILLALGRLFGMRGAQVGVFAIALAQGSEFAFVLLQYMDSSRLVTPETAKLLTLVVALSMAMTPVLMLLNATLLVPRFMSRLDRGEYDRIDEGVVDVIIAGYGRFGQVVGRFLKAQGIRLTILEIDPDQIDLLRKFGTKGYFGDASRLDLLQSAQADKAKLLVVAVDDADKCLEIVRLAKRHFPNLRVLARSRNRRHAYELFKAGVDYSRRETFDSALSLAQQAMKWLGANELETRRKARRFVKHDNATLRKSFEFFDQERELIDFARQSAGELERILNEDVNPSSDDEKSKSLEPV